MATKKTEGKMRRGMQFVLGEDGQPVRCPKCKQKIREVSPKKLLTKEEVIKREARIAKMQANLEEIKLINK
jgi:hypothetical protein